ncbi:hypothetical protein D9758_009514 [Tetrapyrgos nigripes]|uniref:RNA helicase n=1 Tax=Tetrapyrgos nigripes TaxID=182062 RepID=A0A8H5LGF4_9AGAR|nr:hypothetical protein D9758_009514 [Tetrapyrgos nigripes]
MDPKQSQKKRQSQSLFAEKTAAENDSDWKWRRSRWGREINATLEEEGPASRARSDGKKYSQKDGQASWRRSDEERKHSNGKKKYPQSSSSGNALADQTRSTAQSAGSSKSEGSKSMKNSSSSPFTSPPLLPGILRCLLAVLGPKATPSEVQALSLQHILSSQSPPSSSRQWKQFLLASETGSGKSIAYLLPVLQSLKETEGSFRASSHPHAQRKENPRALILAPTHELSRQLSSFAKDLLHEDKLKVVCASQANNRTRSSEKSIKGSASNMKKAFDPDLPHSGAMEFDVKSAALTARQADVFVGTPMKILDLVKGRGWDRVEAGEDTELQLLDENGEKRKWRRGRDKVIVSGPNNRWRAEPEMGLSNVEWVVVDEADVLFDPDFQETTRLLLSEISAARGHPVELTLEPSLSAFTPSETETVDKTVNAIKYPFNLILTSATIPNSLSNYLERYHPSMQRLVSSNVHRLPSTLQTEYVAWSGGNKHADVEKRIRQVWGEDSVGPAGLGGMPKLSKILIFCNKGTRVEALGEYLEEKGIKNVWLTSKADNRSKGSNKHLEGFLKPRPGRADEMVEEEREADIEGSNDPKQTPHVMITTSLLSRGLDFSPDLKNVFIMDEPRNLIDFLHRAGRSARAGARGRVVVFGKYEGRGSSRAREVRDRVAQLGR